MHHISNVHQWGDGDGLFDKCAYGTFSCEEIRAKLWLEPSSPSHTELCSIVLKNTLLRDIKKLSWFQHTGSLEVFHSLITKYCPKRQYFICMGMQARTELAIIDHNHNTDREQAVTAAGIVYCSLHMHVDEMGFCTGQLRYKQENKEVGSKAYSRTQAM